MSKNLFQGSQYDLVVQYMNGDVTGLNEIDVIRARRVEKAFNFLIEFRSKPQAVKFLIDSEECAGRSLSRAKAYEDIALAEKIFIPLTRYSKDLLRHAAVEACLSDIERINVRLKKLEELETGDKPKDKTADWVKLMDLKAKYEKQLAEVAQLKEENAELPDFSKFEPHQINIDIPEEVKLTLQRFTRGAVNISEIMESMAEDVDTQEDE